MSTASSSPPTFEVGIVGAGLAGLACARSLAGLGVTCALFEAAEHVGGRVATDRVEGYLLDRGFQVLLDAYPEARRQLDLAALGLRAFAPGALVRQGGRFWRVVDPWRAPLAGLGTLRAPFVSLADGLRMAAFRRYALAAEPAGGVHGTGDELLRARGFSPALRESFFRPFFGGVTLDPELAIPAAYLRQLFGWFARGSAVLPAAGMQTIPEQLAAALPAGVLRTGTSVAAVTPTSIELGSGERRSCRAVVVAADATSAARLLGTTEAPDWLGTTTLYYAADRSPVGEPLLVLNGDGPGSGPVNHLCALSDAQPSYAPAGSALLSVSVLGVPAAPDDELDASVRSQLAGWYGAPVEAWRRLRVDRIPRALPRHAASAPATRRADGLFVCGDHAATPSIQGALESGRLTAEALSAELAAAQG